MMSRRTVFGLLAATPALPARADPTSSLVAAARSQIGVTTGYDGSYRRLAYPGGDLPRSTGVCADVIVRAARDAWGQDLQRLLHEDMTKAFAAYPAKWGLSRPDSNIDHRRVPNLEAYWARAGAQTWRAKSLTPGFAFPGPLQAGDILTWRNFLGAGPHVGIASKGGPIPMIVHNMGWGTHEDPLIALWFNSATAVFRWRV